MVHPKYNSCLHETHKRARAHTARMEEAIYLLWSGETGIRLDCAANIHSGGGQRCERVSVLVQVTCGVGSNILASGQNIQLASEFVRELHDSCIAVCVCAHACECVWSGVLWSNL